ncbi:Similar to S.cerevisiae protein DAP1 (Heme-binding protein) [Malassezia sympodialis ATCC 42132]|uniref:Similar to S.cerevisiae protein DAP1 (Heme-binding protein) n=1 Tax=Malassezia sympodialis (strain ATCC 42132) TaxID=1230383 RepID=A0A1M8A8F5_MALS4|nr:Similar to S.cerevisiae protein DAP1 (Heme-binding protein) [Malassezia sympodialis ATCC 42132]
MGQIISSLLPPVLQPHFHAIYDNPVNLFLLVLVAPVVYYLFLIPDATSELSQPSVKDAKNIHYNSQYSTLPNSHPESIEWTRYTPRTLALHDGTTPGENGKESRILLAINGNVFDVTKGKNFYGPNGAYGNFAGRDASRGMAKQSFALDMLTPLDQPIDTLSDLTDAERKNMADWETHFAGKYPIVGELVNEETLAK